jgi:hypothetical protein
MEAWLLLAEAQLPGSANINKASTQTTLATLSISLSRAPTIITMFLQLIRRVLKLQLLLLQLL